MTPICSNAREPLEPGADAGSLLRTLRAQAQAGLPLKVRPLAQVIGISPANLYSMIAAGKVEASRPSERRVLVPAHEARRLLGMPIEAAAA